MSRKKANVGKSRTYDCKLAANFTWTVLNSEIKVRKNEHRCCQVSREDVHDRLAGFISAPCRKSRGDRREGLWINLAKWQERNRRARFSWFFCFHDQVCPTRGAGLLAEPLTLALAYSLSTASFTLLLRARVLTLFRFALRNKIRLRLHFPLSCFSPSLSSSRLALSLLLGNWIRSILFILSKKKT